MKTMTFILLYFISFTTPVSAQLCITGKPDPRIATFLKDGMQDIPAAIPNIPKEQIQKERKKADASYGAGDLRRYM